MGNDPSRLRGNWFNGVWSEIQACTDASPSGDSSLRREQAYRAWVNCRLLTASAMINREDFEARRAGSHHGRLSTAGLALESRPVLPHQDSVPGTVVRDWFDMTARGAGSLVPSVSTIQSFQTAETTPQRKKGVLAGTFDVVVRLIPSLRIVIASPQPILTSRLCSRKFRSWRLSSERKKGPVPRRKSGVRTEEGTSLGSTIAS
jgi:hypothetical protein